MVRWLNRVRLNQEIWRYIHKTDSVLDIGCGPTPQRFFDPVVNILCEPYKPYREQLIPRYPYAHVMPYDVQTVGKLFSEKFIETVFMLDVLEHLSLEDGADAIDKLPQLARNQVVIFTPLGFIEQKSNDGNDHQEHISGWMPENFGPEWTILACKRYHYIDGNGSIHNPPRGAFYAIRTMEHGRMAKLPMYRQMVVSSYDVALMVAWRVLRILPESWSKAIVLWVKTHAWRRIGA